MEDGNRSAWQTRRWQFRMEAERQQSRHSGGRNTGLREYAKKKKRKGRDLLKDRPRLESAQTVAATAAAAVKHAFFYHSKISPDSRVLSPSTLSPTVGGKKKKKTKLPDVSPSTDLSRRWWNANGRLALMLQQSCRSATFSCIHHKNMHLFSIYALTTPLCVCVSAHTCRPVCLGKRVAYIAASAPAVWAMWRRMFRGVRSWQLARKEGVQRGVWRFRSLELL